MIKLREVLVKILNEMGFIIFEMDDEDFNIGDYITDSIQFIQFIIKIEQVLNTELSEDFLLFDVLISANGLANKLVDFCEQNDISPQYLKVTVGCSIENNIVTEGGDKE